MCPRPSQVVINITADAFISSGIKISRSVGIVFSQRPSLPIAIEEAIGRGFRGPLGKIRCTEVRFFISSAGQDKFSNSQILKLPNYLSTFHFTSWSLVLPHFVELSRLGMRSVHPFTLSPFFPTLPLFLPTGFPNCRIAQPGY